ncbi:MAG: winged helix-turn-helix domain-containing protein [Chloroflexi bacterium]|nr:winged helix-turn-helix domain-containing protein [Chloroflexota bacterium]
MEDVYFFKSLEQVQATAEPTRWRILNLLVARPMTGSQLARVLGIPRPLAHYHLKVLDKVGLVAFQEERLRGGVVEKYYRARAREFRSDHLTDPARLRATQNKTDSQTMEILRNLITAMVEVAKFDLVQADIHDPLSKAPFNYQNDLFLTSEQTQALIQTLRTIGGEYLKLDRANRPEVEQGHAEDYTHLRLTWLLTPVARLKIEENPTEQEKKKSREKSESLIELV